MSNGVTDRTPLVDAAGQAEVSGNNPTSAMSDNNNVSSSSNNSSSDEEPPVPEQKALIFAIIMTAISCGVAVGTNLWISGIISFGINWGIFAVYAWPFHTEKIYDFMGMITFLSVDLFAFIYYNARYDTFNSIRSSIMFICPLVWTLRLGTFLFRRILGEGGSDKRFDPIRNSWPRFFMSWTLQAVWAYFCMLPVIVAQYRAKDEKDISALDIIGWILWCIGWGIEIIADTQKTKFKENPSNRGKFCNVGLWSVSRHPNYFGEILLWWGLAIAACSVIKEESGDWLLFLSPIWTMTLLIGLSGIPLSEKAADKKYGNVDGYTQYKASVPVLIPFCYCWK